MSLKLKIPQATKLGYEITKTSDRVIVLGRINSSQDGVIVDREGIAPCLTSGHMNCPKIVEYKDKE